jgi:hypothetical protein
VDQVTFNEAIKAATERPDMGLGLPDQQQCYLIDSKWFEKGWLLGWYRLGLHKGHAGGWSPHIHVAHAARDDWKLYKLPAPVRDYLKTQFDNPHSARRCYSSKKAQEANRREEMGV